MSPFLSTLSSLPPRISVPSALSTAHTSLLVQARLYGLELSPSLVADPTHPVVLHHAQAELSIVVAGQILCGGG